MHTSSTAAPDHARLPNLRRAVRAFAAWDGGMSAFSSVILTFVFATWVVSAVAPAGLSDPAEIEAAKDYGSQTLTTYQSIGAVMVALLAPLLGNLADAGGKRNLMLRIATIATILVVATMPLITPEQSSLHFAAILIALAVVFSELAGVFVNSVLPEISTEANRGRISGTAWAVGYWGSIGCLLLVLFLFVMPGTGLLGLSGDNGLNYRMIPAFVAAWILIGTTPLMLWAPSHAGRNTADHEHWTPLSGYKTIGKRVLRAYRDEPQMLHFLVSSAIYRDGLGAVFSVAGILAAVAYGFSGTEVILFGVAANLVAGFGVFLGGKADDRFGPRAVIIVGCLGVIALGTVVLFSEPKIVFWVAGLAICMFVGPVQSASRNLLTRLSEPGRETENFGLYATTGRALGFLGTGAFAVAVSVLGSTRMGIAGIVLVMAVGLLAFLPLKLGAAGGPARATADA